MADEKFRNPTDVPTDLQTGAGSPLHARAFFGHPRGLVTLLLTEMWERFSFYGMRALLYYYLIAAIANGGMDWTKGDSNAFVGVYVAMVYITSLPGSWLADRVFGARKSVLYGGATIAAGHLCMAIPGLEHIPVAIGLTLIVIGTGLLKPNMSSMVGELYSKEDERRDAGFSLFYMGINIGAFFAPLICGTLGQQVDWHLGFGAAGVGMIFGLIQYVAGGKYLGTAGLSVPNPIARPALIRTAWISLMVLAVASAIFTMDVVSGNFTINHVTNALAILAVGIPIFYIGRIVSDRRLTALERTRMTAYVWLFILSAAFWLIYDQAANVLSDFAEDKTNRNVFGWDFPSSWFQSVNPVYLVLLAPVAAWFWLRKGKNLSTPTKFIIGLVLNGLSFVVMAVAAAQAVEGHLVSLWWLVAVYGLQTLGELAISPVGLSVTTKLAPKLYLNQMMGIWFLSTACGDAIGGQVARLTDKMDLSHYFLMAGLSSIVLGLAAIMFTKNITRLMSGVR